MTSLCGFEDRTQGFIPVKHAVLQLSYTLALRVFFVNFLACTRNWSCDVGELGHHPRITRCFLPGGVARPF